MTFTVVRPFYVVGGDGKVCGRDESLPYKSTAKRSTAVSRGPGMPGPYKWAEVYPCGGSGELPNFKTEEGSAALRTDSNTASV